MELTFKNYKGQITVTTYANGDYSLSLTSLKHGPIARIARITTWVPDLAPDEYAIKNWSENEGMLEALVDQDIVHPSHRDVDTGFVTVPIVKLKVSINQLKG